MEQRNMACVKSRQCSVWVGAETGILKGVCVSRKQVYNFCEMRSLSRDEEICTIAWGDEHETEVLIGSVNGRVKTFSTEKGIFTESRECADLTHGRFTGIAVTDRSLITCVESGLLKVWPEAGNETVEINVGSGVCRMRQNPSERHHVATGGKENPLKVWDLQRPDTPIFTAKNVANDWLDLRVPVWVRDMAFLTQSNKIITCTGHHQVRVYDPLCRRRPVLEAEFGEVPLTALSVPPGENSVVVGNTHGQLANLDLRKGVSCARVYERHGRQCEGVTVSPIITPRCLLRPRPIPPHTQPTRQKINTQGVSEVPAELCVAIQQRSPAVCVRRGRTAARD
ncbi:hypothetical protein QTP86_023832 [Hemibagrus guttatus]|nr:hypothetical protein QTP86_023832 [Hemibagrus guttatus]